MANRNNNRMSGGYDRRPKFNRSYDRNSGNQGGYGRPQPQFNISPWQASSGPGAAAPAHAPNAEATLALANNLINNLLQRQGGVPSLLDINTRHGDFNYNRPNFGDGDRRMPNRMGMGGRGPFPAGMHINKRQPMGTRPVPNARRPQRPKPQQKNFNPGKKDPKTGDANAASVDSAGQDGEGKREWKQEKGAEGAENATETPKEETNGGATVKTDYDDISPEFLECHICEKNMWDGRSFDNHIKGRSHRMMMEKTTESYRMTADAMRQEQSVLVMRKNIKHFAGARKVYCAMCDLFVVVGGSHRRSQGHQNLKKYLHPSCSYCNKEMPTRIEMDEHCLTAQHLRAVQTKVKDGLHKPKPETMVFSTLQDEMNQLRMPKKKQNKKGAAVTAKEGEVAEGQDVEMKAEGEEGGEAGEGLEGEVKPEVDDAAAAIKLEEEALEDKTYTILDYKEDDDLATMTRENLPKYRVDRALGASFINDFTYKQCTLCRKLFDSEETALVHTRTWRHFQAFIRLLHAKGNFKPQESAVKREHTEAEGSEEQDEEGNWKRRKVDAEEGDESCADVSQANNSLTDTEIEAEINSTTIGNGDAKGENWDINEDIDNLLNDVAVDPAVEEPAVVEPEPEPVPEPVPVVAPAPVKASPKASPQPYRGRGRGRGNRSRRGGYNRI